MVVRDARALPSIMNTTHAHKYKRGPANCRLLVQQPQGEAEGGLRDRLERQGLHVGPQVDGALWRLLGVDAGKLPVMTIVT